MSGTQPSKLDSTTKRSSRAISSITGVALIIAVALILATATTLFVFNLTDNKEGQPSASFEGEISTENPIEYRMTMESGEQLNMSHINLIGAVFVSDQPDSIAAGESILVQPLSKTIALTWQDQPNNSSERSYTLHRETFTQPQIETDIEGDSRFLELRNSLTNDLITEGYDFDNDITVDVSLADVNNDVELIINLPNNTTERHRFNENESPPIIPIITNEEGSTVVSIEDTVLDPTGTEYPLQVVVTIED